MYNGNLEISKNNYDISLDVLIDEKYKDKFKTISLDGKKALLINYNNNSYISKFEILELESNKIIFTDSLNTSCYAFSPKLNYYITKKDNQLHIYDIKNKTNKVLNLIFPEDVYSIVFSPDEKAIAYITKDKDYNYICIYDITLPKIIHVIPIGKGRVNLCQWHQDNKLLYQYEYNSFIMNIDGTNKKLLGKYMFDLLLSPDTKYLVYSRHGCGYAKTKQTYFNNNRVKKIKIELSDGSQIIEELKDNNLESL